MERKIESLIEVILRLNIYTYIENYEKFILFTFPIDFVCTEHKY